MSSLRRVCAAACFAFAIPAVAEDAAPRLVDFAGDAAVFEIGSRAHVIRMGRTLPGTGATLRHVGQNSVVVEISAASARPPILLELGRGEALVPPESAGSPSVVMPNATILQIEPETSAAGKQR